MQEGVIQLSTMTLDIVHRILPCLQPRIRQLAKVCSTLEMSSKVNLVTIPVEPHDVVPVGGCPAAASLEATVQERPDP